ncbi:multidrug resistance protein fnx1 [Lichtheimia corymbifera JMRC:FSU:9682]|uniref:MFS-type drug efflux transporter P55 n=1 Tax=Lichtheimia corymbifera JMRC:FSU:9682 TaxID=1263082 RepID=A0A068RZS1_9FUNG|nr:multidrug resistance protein fnx1 [Lichtheimia corymbifera JMRC:FSU:9682]
MTGDPREDKQSLLRSQDVYDRSIKETTQSYRSIDVNSGDTSEDDDTNTSGVSLILLTLCLAIGSGLPCVDVSICFTIMTQIGTEFQNAHLSTWIHNSYTLACMTTLPIAGKLADIFGRKPILVGLTTLFLLGSYGCGVAQTLPQIVVARAIAGFGSGGAILMANVVIHDLVPLAKRSRYQSVLSTVQSLGIAFGSPLGGFITDTFGWRYCFKINIFPLLFNVYVYCFRLNNYCAPSMRKDISVWDQLRSIDFPGVVLLSSANVLLVIAFLFGGNTHPWTHPLILGVLGGAFVTFMLFALHQAYGTCHPLVKHTLATNRNVLIGCIGMFLTCFSDGSLNYSQPQFFMGVLGFTTSKSGLWNMVEALALPLGSMVVGQYIRKTGYFKACMIMMGAVSAISAGCLTQWMVGKLPFFIGIILFVLLGIAIGSLLVIVTMATVSDIPKSEVSSAMLMMILCRFIGYTMGPASVAAIVQGNIKDLLHKRITGPDADELIRFIRTSIRKTYTLSPELQAIVADVLGQTLQKAFFMMSIAMTVATCIFLLARNINLKTANHK